MEVVTRTSVFDANLSDHQFAEIRLSHNPSNRMLAIPLILLGNQYIDYERIITIDRKMLCDIARPGAFYPTSSTDYCIRILSHKKRKLRSKLNVVRNNPHTLLSLRSKL